MSKIDKLKQKYQADTDAMASKSRFGYFSLLPSHTAAKTDFVPAKHPRNQDGKVTTEPRNIFSGTNSTGTLKKNYFSYVPSAFHGSPFQDPGKIERKAEIQENKKWKDRQIYKPARQNSSAVKAAYEYMSDTDPKKPMKKYRNSDGKVITQSCNVLVSPQSKIEYNKVKVFKYVECPTVQKKIDKNEEDNKHDEPFRAGNAHREVFSPHAQIYFDTDIKKKQQKAADIKKIQHEAAFKPSCISPDTLFTPVVYKQEGTGKSEVKIIKKQNKQGEPFKLTKIEHSSKPTPSISCSKTNLLRGCR